MATNDYHFITNWRVPGSVQDVYDIISDNKSLAQWWPSVYLAVEELDPGAPDGMGKVIRLHTTGWLPYTLHWDSRTVAVAAPHRLVIEATGDFVGRGEWTFEPDGPYVNVAFDWRIRADKPLLRTLSPLLKPIFAANHRWAMARGEESLRLELERRQAPTPEARALIPAPPGRNTTSTYWLVGGAAIIGTILLRLHRLKRVDEQEPVSR